MAQMAHKTKEDLMAHKWLKWLISALAVRCPVAAEQARPESGSESRSEERMSPFASKPAKKKRPVFTGRRAGDAITSGVHAE
jgi:hypothetical protein